LRLATELDPAIYVVWKRMSVTSSHSSDLMGSPATDKGDRAHVMDCLADSAVSAKGARQHTAFEDAEDDYEEDSAADDYAQYRTLSPSAVVSCVLGVGSVVAFFNWWLAVLPLAGLVVGVFALRRIAARSDELTGRLPALLGVVLSAVCLVGGQATLWYIRLTEVPDGHIRMSYEDLQPDPRVINQIVPTSAEKLDGERVFIKGYVLAGNRKDGIRTFILVRDQGDCCFGGNPKLTDRILVHLKPSNAFTYTNTVQKLIGRFEIRPGRAIDVSGDVVYQLDDAEIL
jgi:hypothetical protein